MKPTEFPEQNCVYAEGQEEYLSLPAFQHGDPWGQVTSCWQMSWRERLKCLWTGRVYVSLLTFGQPLQPQIISLEIPQVME